MKQPFTLILRAVIIVIGMLALGVCVFVIPRIIDTFQLGGYDPILLGLYVPAVPFFIVLYQSLNILSQIDAGKTISASTVTSLRVIKFCGITISSIFLAAMPYIFYVADIDDAPGVVAIGLIIVFLSFVVGAIAMVLQRILQNAVDIKYEK